MKTPKAMGVGVLALQVLAVVIVLLGAGKVAFAGGDATCDYTVYTMEDPYTNPDAQEYYNGNCTKRSCDDPPESCNATTMMGSGSLMYQVCFCDDGSNALCYKGFIPDAGSGQGEGTSDCIAGSCTNDCTPDWSEGLENPFELYCDCIQ